jgi:hypothetical protein
LRNPRRCSGGDRPRACQSVLSGHRRSRCSTPVPACLRGQPPTACGQSVAIGEEGRVGALHCRTHQLRQSRRAEPLPDPAVEFTPGRHRRLAAAATSCGVQARRWRRPPGTAIGAGWSGLTTRLSLGSVDVAWLRARARRGHARPPRRCPPPGDDKPRLADHPHFAIRRARWVRASPRRHATFSRVLRFAQAGTESSKWLVATGAG